MGTQEVRTHTTEDWLEKEVGSWGASAWRSPVWEAVITAWTLSSAPGMWTAHRWVWKQLIEFCCVLVKVLGIGLFFFFFKFKGKRVSIGQPPLDLQERSI